MITFIVYSCVAVLVTASLSLWFAHGTVSDADDLLLAALAGLLWPVAVLGAVVFLAWGLLWLPAVATDGLARLFGRR